MEQGAHRYHHSGSGGWRRRSGSGMNPVIDYDDIPELHVAARESSIDRAWWAVVARFLIHGLVVSSWVSRIPSVKAGLQLGDGVFGFSLFGSALGSVVGIPISGWLVERYEIGRGSCRDRGEISVVAGSFK